jgi:metal-responsive CopG/Arc/MetJ family transcriptional regulator
MITFRADKETEQKLNELAIELKKTRTEVLREALHLYLEGHRPGSKRKTKSRKTLVIQEFIGVWDGPEDSSVDTGKKFGDHLIESRKGRRH